MKNWRRRKRFESEEGQFCEDEEDKDERIDSRLSIRDPDRKFPFTSVDENTRENQRRLKDIVENNI